MGRLLYLFIETYLNVGVVLNLVGQGRKWYFFNSYYFMLADHEHLLSVLVLGKVWNVRGLEVLT